MEEAVNLVHFCSECNKGFRISKLLFEHQVLHHSGLKVSNMIGSLAEAEMYYSSDSDCDYTIIVEVTKTPKSYRQFQKRVGTIEEQKLELVEKKEELWKVDKSQASQLVCEYCDKEFAYEQLLKEHIQYRHIEEDGVIELDLANLDKNQPMQCPQCDSKLKNFKFYRRHIKLRHNLIVWGMPFGEGDMKVKLSDLPIQMKFSNLNKGKKGPYKCKYCEKALNNGKLLKEHIRMTHKLAAGFVQLDWQSMEEFICPECGKQVKSRRNLRRHLRLCHNLSVQRAYSSRDGSMQVSEHTISKQFPIIKVAGEVYEETTQYWTCGMCDKGPVSKKTRYVYEHQVECHGRPRKKEYICEYCNKTCFKRANIIEHLKSHTNNREFSCDICNARFNGQHSLNKHKTFHLALRCGLCEAEFSLRSEYKAHHKAMHKGQLKAFQVTEETEDSIIITNTTQEPKGRDNMVYQCQGCQKEFRSAKGLKEHLCRELSEMGSSATCNACGKVFNSRAGFKGHCCKGLEESGHVPLFSKECVGCHKIFKSRQGFKAHICDELVTNQKEGNILSCSACSKTFKSKAGQRGHMCQALLASGERPPPVEVCRGCLKEFKSKAGLRGHSCPGLLELGYEPKQSFQCANCSKTFKSKKGFEGHRCSKGAALACTLCDDNLKYTDVRSYCKHNAIVHQKQLSLSAGEEKVKEEAHDVALLTEELGSEVIIS